MLGRPLLACANRSGCQGMIDKAKKMEQTNTLGVEWLQVRMYGMCSMCSMMSSSSHTNAFASFVLLHWLDSHQS